MINSLFSNNHTYFPFNQMFGFLTLTSKWRHNFSMRLTWYSWIMVLRIHLKICLGERNDVYFFNLTSISPNSYVTVCSSYYAFGSQRIREFWLVNPKTHTMRNANAVEALGTNTLVSSTLGSSASGYWFESAHRHFRFKSNLCFNLI